MLIFLLTVNNALVHLQMDFAKGLIVKLFPFTYQVTTFIFATFLHNRYSTI